MPLIGCFVTPHPPIMVPEVGGPELVHVEATVKAMRAVGEKTARLDPDTNVLLSPHAPLARSQMGSPWPRRIVDPSPSSAPHRLP